MLKKGRCLSKLWVFRFMFVRRSFAKSCIDMQVQGSEGTATRLLTACQRCKVPYLVQQDLPVSVFHAVAVVVSSTRHNNTTWIHMIHQVWNSRNLSEVKIERTLTLNSEKNGRWHSLQRPNQSTAREKEKPDRAKEVAVADARLPRWFFPDGVGGKYPYTVQTRSWSPSRMDGVYRCVYYM